MEWAIDFDGKNKIWRWSVDLPNGWSALVVDDSQFGYPKRPTHYLANAVSRMRIIQGKRYRTTLAEAKTEALDLALAQQVSENP